MSMLFTVPSIVQIVVLALMIYLVYIVRNVIMRQDKMLGKIIEDTQGSYEILDKVQQNVSTHLDQLYQKVLENKGTIRTLDELVRICEHCRCKSEFDKYNKKEEDQREEEEEEEDQREEEDQEDQREEEYQEDQREEEDQEDQEDQEEEEISREFYINFLEERSNTNEE